MIDFFQNMYSNVKREASSSATHNYNLHDTYRNKEEQTKQYLAQHYNNQNANQYDYKQQHHNNQNYNNNTSGVTLPEKRCGLLA